MEDRNRDESAMQNELNVTLGLLSRVADCAATLGDDPSPATVGEIAVLNDALAQLVADLEHPDADDGDDEGMKKLRERCNRGYNNPWRRLEMM